MQDQVDKYFPTDEGEQNYLTYLQGPGDDLGLFMKDLENGNEIKKALPKKDAETKESEAREAEAKKPASKASSKKAGAGAKGKIRYSYPGEDEGKKAKTNLAKNPPSEKPPEPGSPAEKDPEEPAGPVQEPVKSDPAAQKADASKFAHQVGMNLDSLKKMARKFQSKKELKGRTGFQDFMVSNLKAFVKKHKQVDRDYFGLLYDNLISGESNVGKDS